MWGYLIATLSPVALFENDKDLVNTTIAQIEEKLASVDDQVNLTQLVLGASYRLEEMIPLHLCYFDGLVRQPCSKDDFRSTITLDGLCFTFNWDANNPVKQISGGLGRGLTINVNVLANESSGFVFHTHIVCHMRD